mmetsp:Transcript_54049/g.173309  ORF Transcript_54049/g.173309 Transcript_54049/m.173309 type:complete len:201 (-) Transcript_54049:72-674(-)
MPTHGCTPMSCPHSPAQRSQTLARLSSQVKAWWTPRGRLATSRRMGIPTARRPCVTTVASHRLSSGRLASAAVLKGVISTAMSRPTHKHMPVLLSSTTTGSSTCPGGTSTRRRDSRQRRPSHCSLWRSRCTSVGSGRTTWTSCRATTAPGQAPMCWSSASCTCWGHSALQPFCTNPMSRFWRASHRIVQAFVAAFLMPSL